MRNSRMSLLGACVFVFGGVLIAAEFQESVEKDMQFLEGSFSMVSSEKKGEKASENIVKSATITNKNGVHSVKVGEDSFGGTHKIDPTKSLKKLIQPIRQANSRGRHIWVFIKSKKMFGLFASLHLEKNALRLSAQSLVQANSSMFGKKVID